MFDKLKHIEIINIKHVCAIDLEVLLNGTYRIKGIALTKQKQAIDFEEIEIQSFEELSNVITPQTPLCVVLSGKGIIHRSISTDAKTTDEELIKKVIPNANIEDFYLQSYLIHEDNAKQQNIVSIARKTVIDAILKELLEKTDYIVSVSISPFTDSELFSLIENEKFVYKNYIITIKNHRVVDFTGIEEREQQSIKIGDKQIDSELVPALALGFSYLLDYKNANLSIPIVKEKSTEYIYKQKFFSIGKMVLSIAFGLLLINFLVFDYYYKRSQDNYQRVSSQEVKINKLEKLKETFDAKSKFLESTGFLEQNRLSLYIDQIAAVVPQAISLTDMQINPLSDPNKKEQLEFTNKLIRVSGTSNRSMAFNEWVKQLKKNEAFDNITILNYEQDKQENQALFTIEIHVK